MSYRKTPTKYEWLLGDIPSRLGVSDFFLESICLTYLPHADRLDTMVYTFAAPRRRHETMVAVVAPSSSTRHKAFPKDLDELSKEICHQSSQIYVDSILPADQVSVIGHVLNSDSHRVLYNYV